MADFVADFRAVGAPLVSSIDPFDFDAVFAPMVAVNDVTPPVVTLISPPTTQQIGRNEAIKVLVSGGPFDRLYVWVEYDYGTEVIYAGDRFTPRFAPLSTLTGSTTEKTFTIKRSGGWLHAPRIYVEPIDESGNHG